MDSRGVDALIALSRLERMGLRSPEGVKTFQSNAGLVVDGVVGKKTLGALGIQHLE
jgi:murein L,D-transpeptidase YcbB/YkuD